MADWKMVDIEKLETGLRATADAVRAKTGETEQIEWAEDGFAGKVEQVFEAGKKSEWDALWDALQDKGNKSIYLSEFQSPSWTNENFKPKYKIFANSTTFSNGGDGDNYSCSITDLRTETLGIEIDWSKCNNFNYILRKVPIEYLSIIDMSNAQYGWCLFSGAETLKSIEKVILPPKESNIAFKHLGFRSLSKLENISFEGQFDYSVDFYECHALSKSSIINIINALSIESLDQTTSFPLATINNIFETGTGLADGSTSQEWLDLIATKSNWTISLV